MKAQRRDSNEEGIVEALEDAGYRVSRHYTPDPFDLAIARVGSPMWLHVEVKTPKGSLTIQQEGELAVHGIVVVRTADEAIRAAERWL